MPNTWRSSRIPNRHAYEVIFSAMAGSRPRMFAARVRTLPNRGMSRPNRKQALTSDSTNSLFDDLWGDWHKGRSLPFASCDRGDGTMPTDRNRRSLGRLLPWWRHLRLRTTIRVAIAAGLAWTAGPVLREYWLRDARENSIARAYSFAIAHPEVSTYLPCYCGCGRNYGHDSVDACFVSRRDAHGRMVARDNHAETCPVCVDVINYAAARWADGAELTVIREELESRYQDDQALRSLTAEVPEATAAGARHPDGSGARSRGSADR